MRMRTPRKRRVRTLPALVLLLAVAGCKTTQDTTRVELLAAENAYREADYRAAIDRLSAYLQAHPESEHRARAQYVRGLAAARAGQRSLAYSDFEQAAERASDGQIAWSAAAVLGVLHFEDERWDSAAYWLEKAVREMPTVAPMDALLFRLGLCRERTSRWEAAEAAYRRVVQLFPSGRYSDLARRRLEVGAASYAVQCGVFSNPRNAERLENQLRRNGLDPRVEQEARDGRPYYVVLVGKYKDYEAACNALAQVKGYVPQAVLWP
jgi:TolA-binding protein